MANLIETFEGYLLASDQEAFIKSIIYNKELYKFLRLTHDLKHHGIDLPSESKKMMVELEESLQMSKPFKKILLKKILAEIEKVDDPVRLGLLFEQLNENYFRIDFEQHQKAQIHGSSSLIQQNSEDIKSSLNKKDMEPFNLDLQISKLYAMDPESFYATIKTWKVDLLKRIDLLKLAEKTHVSVLNYVLGQFDSLDHISNLSQIVMAVIQKMAEVNSSSIEDLDISDFPLDEKNFRKMTIPQIKEIMGSFGELLFGSGLDTLMVGILFKKEFPDFNKVEEEGSYTKMDVYIERMEKWSEDLPFDTSCLSAQILLIRLYIEEESGNFNLDNFMKFIQDPAEPESLKNFFTNTYYQSIEDSTKVFRDSEYKRGLQSKYLISGYLMNTITSHLKHHIVKKGDYNEFKKYFKDSFLYKTFLDGTIDAGLKFSDPNGLLTDDNLEKRKKKTVLNFSQKNPTSFQVGDRVALLLKVKNVEELTVNIYEINLLNYYKKNLNNVALDLDLTGLKGNHSFKKHLGLQNEPFKISEIEIELPSLSERKRGVFIVEFKSMEVVTKAIIRKGALTFVERNTPEGLEFFILDQQKEICQGEKTGIIKDGTFYAADSTGRILLNYATSRTDTTLILVNDEFCDIISTQLPEEKVHFDFSVLYNEEALHSGEKPTFAIQPKFLVTSEIADLSLIKEVSLKIQMITRQNMVDIVVKEDIKLSYDKDLVEEVILPSGISKISFEISGKYFSKSSDKNVDIKLEKTIGILRAEGKNFTSDTYLDQKDGEYLLRTLGRNGESMKNIEYSVALESSYFTPTHSFKMTSDSEGVIRLGKLENVKNLSVKTNHSAVIQLKNFDLEEKKDFCLPDSFNILEGEEIRLPRHPNPKVTRKYTFLKTLSNFDEPLYEITDSISEEGDMIYLRGLKEGFYKFKYDNLPNYSRVIAIQVHNGTRQQIISGNLLVKEHEVIKLSSENKYLLLDEFKLQESELSFNVLSNHPDTVKVHALGLNYYPTIPTMIQKLNSLIVHEESTSFKLRMNKSTYSNQEGLSKEMTYALNRPTENPPLGITLERPSALFRPEFSQLTSKRNVNFPPIVPPRRSRQSNNVSKQIIHTPTMVKGNMHYHLPILNEFLGKRGLFRRNLEADADGQVSIDLSQCEDYSVLLLLVEDSKSFILKVVPLGVATPRTLKDIRLKQSRDPSKLHIYNRSTASLQPSQSHTINDLSTTKYCVVDDIFKLHDSLRAVNNGASWVNQLNFLLEWTSLTEADKIRRYDELMSHELNLFCYFKDEQFFESIIINHLRNKSDLQLVDHFLLGNSKELALYLTPYRLDQLNNLEQILLLIAFREERPSDCRRIVRSMEMRLAANGFSTVNYKRLFDTVVNSNSAQATSSDSSQAPGQSVASLGMGGGTRRRVTSNRIYNNKDFKPAAIYGSVRESIFRAQDEKGNNNNSSGKNSTSNNRSPASAYDQTKEYAERQYIGIETSPCSQFWLDLATYLFEDGNPDSNFLTHNFIYCKDFLSAFTALTFIDLPLKRTDTDLEVSGDGIRVKMNDSQTGIVLSKVFKEKETEKMDLDISISQKIFDLADQYILAPDGTTKVFKAVDAFLINKLYGCRIAVTNTTDSSQRVQVVYEIPQGSIPVNTLFYLQNKTLDIDSLQTKVLNYYFYFAEEGSFSLYPASITKEGFLVAQASIKTQFQVLRTIKKEVFSTINEVIDLGGKSDVLSFLESQNILNSQLFQFKKIYWLLKDKDFYLSVLKIMKNRGIFEPTVWSYCIYHSDRANLGHFLEYAIRQMGINSSIFISNSFVSIDKLELKEYNPLVNPRIHGYGDNKQKFLTSEFKDAYQDFLEYALEKKVLSSHDLLRFTVYLIFQDRFEEAITMFGRIEQSQLEDQMIINFDYLRSYLDLYSGFPDYKIAREVCTTYLSYPILHWRNKFVELANQIAEFDGEVALENILDKNDDARKGEEDSEEYLKAVLKDQDIVITSKNVEWVDISYYIVELEPIYTKNPFRDLSTTNASDFSFVKPVLKKRIPINVENQASEFISTSTEIADQDLRKQNLVVEITTNQKTVTLNYFPSELEVYVIEKLGQVKIKHKGKPLMKVYVKCMTKNSSNQMVFHKDGYTDLRGTFNYAYLNSDPNTEIMKFSIFIKSKELGAQIFSDIGLPKTMEETKSKELQILSQTWKNKKQSYKFSGASKKKGKAMYGKKGRYSKMQYTEQAGDKDCEEQSSD